MKPPTKAPSLTAQQAAARLLVSDSGSPLRVGWPQRLSAALRAPEMTRLQALLRDDQGPSEPAHSTVRPSPGYNAVLTDTALASITIEQICAELRAARVALAWAPTLRARAAASDHLKAMSARARSWARERIAHIAGSSCEREAIASSGCRLSLYEGCAPLFPARAAPCVSHALRVFRAIDVSHAPLENDASPLASLTTLLAIADSRAAWVDARDANEGQLPSKGDFIVVDAPDETESAHVVIVVAVPGEASSDANAFVVDTVGCAHSALAEPFAFAVQRHTLYPRNDTLLLGTRRIVGWIDGGLLGTPDAEPWRSAPLR